LSQTVITKK